MMPCISRQFIFLAGICDAFLFFSMVFTLQSLSHDQRNTVFFITSLGCQNQITVGSIGKRTHRLVGRLFVQIYPDGQGEIFHLRQHTVRQSEVSFIAESRRSLLQSVYPLYRTSVYPGIIFLSATSAITGRIAFAFIKTETEKRSPVTHLPSPLTMCRSSR